MSGWLSRAKNALSGRAVEITPEPIEIACPCGRAIEIARRDTFQRALCKGCGEAFFILPLDVYPRPVIRKVRKVTPTQPEPSEKPAESKAAAAALAETPVRQRIDLSAKLEDIKRKIGAQFTPLRIIVACLVLVIGGTGWWQWNRRARGQAEMAFKTATAAGQAAMQKRDFDAAELEYRRAVQAIDVLGRTDAPATQIRQLARELTAINSMLRRSLAELVIDASQTRNASGAAAAELAFQQAHANRWVVLLSDITPATAETPTPIWEQRIDIRINPDSEPEPMTEAVMLMAELSVFKLIPPLDAAPPQPPNLVEPQPAGIGAALGFNDLGQREVIFAAQVAALRWDETNSIWRLSFQPATGFLWTDFDVLAEAGLKPDEIRTEADLKQRLAEQSRWIGVEP